MNKICDVIRKIIYLLNRPQKMLCILVLLLTLLGSVLECLGVSVILPVMWVLLEPKQFLNSAVAQMFPILQTLNYNGLIVCVMTSVIALYLLKNGFFVFLSWARIKFACKIQRELSIRMIESYMSRGYEFFLQKNYGELNRGVEKDTEFVYNILYAGFRLISDLATVLLICVFMFFTDWQFSLAMVIMSVICIWLIYTVFKKHMSKAGVQYSDYSAKAGQAIYEAFEGVKDVLVLRKQWYFVNSYKKNRIQVQIAQSKQVVGLESPAYIIEGLCVSGFMLTMLAKAVVDGLSSDFIATIAAFAIGAFRILPSLGKISASSNHFLTYLPGVDSVYNNIVEANQYAQFHPEAIFYSKNRKSDEEQENKRYFNDSLMLCDISFRYSKSIDNIFEHLNLSIKKGQSIAIIGTSGAGKSTLADILLGLLVPQQGKILIDGTDITQIADEWANLVGYVPQSVFLSSGSIKENIAFGMDESEIDENLVKDVLKRAELLDFVETLPAGLNTLVGDRGLRLSGGQRQRIAIARALYHKPEIMVLDEATSALDNETETAIMSAINALQGQITLIIIAHRLTTIKNCDVIYEVTDKNIYVRDKDVILRGEYQTDTAKQE